MKHLLVSQHGSEEGGRTAPRAPRPAPERATADWPLVSVVLPVRNERAGVERALRSVMAQDYPLVRMEVIVVDGCSDDGTAARARSLLGLGSLDTGTNTAGFSRALLIDNPDCIVPVAMNLGIAASRGTYVVRVDGHCEIETDYVSRCIELLVSGRYSNVGGRCVAEGDTPWARAIAAAQSSRFGVGNVDFRTGTATAGETDTVPFGAWPRQTLVDLGGFDEELVRNQDDELNFRIVQQGGVVWFDPAIVSYYRGRESLRGLWRQYFQYGCYKVRVMQKRGGVASPRHLVPAAFVGGTVAAVLFATLRRSAVLPLVLAGLYSTATLCASTGAARRSRAAVWRIAVAIVTLHFAYGAGSWAGVARFRRGFRRHPLAPPSPTQRALALSTLAASDERVA